jgi:hypothetical protein
MPTTLSELFAEAPCRIRAHCHTCAVYFPNARGTADEPELPHYPNMIWQRAFDREGNHRGWSCRITQPSRQQIIRLSPLVTAQGGYLVRRDVAIDFQMSNAADAKALRELLESQLALKWARGDMIRDRATTYFTAVKLRRNLVLYDDKPNSLTDEWHCVHLELRQRNLGRQHGADGAKLPLIAVRVNPAALLSRHLHCSSFAAHYLERVLGPARSDDVHSPHYWREQRLRRRGLHKLQVLKQHLGTHPAPDLPKLPNRLPDAPQAEFFQRLPKRLSWPRQRPRLKPLDEPALIILISSTVVAALSRREVVAPARMQRPCFSPITAMLFAALSTVPVDRVADGDRPHVDRLDRPYVLHPQRS